jgi:hypothetical protein
MAERCLKKNRIKIKDKSKGWFGIDLKKLNRKSYLDIINLKTVVMTLKFFAVQNGVASILARKKAAKIVSAFIRRKLTLLKFQKHCVKVLDTVRKFGQQIITQVLRRRLKMDVMRGYWKQTLIRLQRLALAGDKKVIKTYKTTALTKLNHKEIKMLL